MPLAVGNRNKLERLKLLEVYFSQIKRSWRWAVAWRWFNSSTILRPMSAFLLAISFWPQVATAILLTFCVISRRKEGWRQWKQRGRELGETSLYPFYQEGSHFSRSSTYQVFPYISLAEMGHTAISRPIIGRGWGDAVALPGIDPLLSISWSKIRVLHSGKEWGVEEGKEYWVESKLCLPQRESPRM